MNGTAASPLATARHAASAASLISREAYSAWPYSLWENSRRSCMEWYDDRSGSVVPTAFWVKIVVAPVARSSIRCVGPIQSAEMRSLPSRNSPCSE